MDDLDQFLLKMKLDLDSIKEQDYLEPCRYIYWSQFLIPMGFEVVFKELDHFFINESADPAIYKSAVIHGHKAIQGCSAPRMCHMYGFWPTPEYNPRFKKIFEARWKPAYALLNWEIPK